MSENENNNISFSLENVKNKEGLLYLKDIDSNSINLVLTDPPYITSKDTGMDAQANIVKKYKETKVNTKTEAQWKKYRTKDAWKKFMDTKKIPEDKRDKKLAEYKINYMKYGSIYGSKYAVKTNYGDWDKKFTIDILDKFVKEFFRVLKDGGTLIIFFDLWKITDLKKIMESTGFKQIRFIEWIKTNPQPSNSGTNYLTNCREIALFGIKNSKPTFNSKYDNGIYMYPLQNTKNKFHPTQKSLNLFEKLIEKHSNENDIVLDTFLGSGTTAIACKNKKRKFKGCEVSKEYYDKLIQLLK